jgi:hypothetical protein
MCRGLGLARRRRGRGGVNPRGGLRRGLGFGNRRRGRGWLMAVGRRRCRGLRRGLGLARRCSGRGGVVAARVLHPVQRQGGAGQREEAGTGDLGCLRFLHGTAVGFRLGLGLPTKHAFRISGI